MCSTALANDNVQPCFRWGQTQKATGRKVAIKRIAMKLGKYTEGANFTALREIKLLQELKHQHVIEVGPYR